MFWTRRQPSSPAALAALDALFAAPETDRHGLAERMVGTGEWRQTEVDEAIRLARRLQTFVQDITISFTEKAAGPQPIAALATTGDPRPRRRRRHAA